MSFIRELVLLPLIFAALILADPIPRLSGGQDVDNLRQFPHHVIIVPYKSYRKCGGSILNAQWIMTSAACIKDSVRLDLEFQKQKDNDQSGAFFTVSVNSDQVYVYPTNYDDLALIRIPIRLVFADNIAPISISSLSIGELRNRFVVMPGFSDPVSSAPVSTTPSTTSTYYSTGSTPPSAGSTTTTPRPITTVPNYPSTVAVSDNLKYGMFEVLDNSRCKEAYGSGKFDEYTQLCIGSWGSNKDTPCDSDFGSGLIVGWPAKNELIGVFSMFSPSCDNSRPSIFTYAPKYLPWIQSMIQG